ncbi:MAG: DUF2975 domain-containing protein, partial [Methanomassiliicoccaceae archaeon]|nr:DUF2975 domain-containing protein [Methanomassiliicoccaceae archaeon]
MADTLGRLGTISRYAGLATKVFMALLAVAVALTLALMAATALDPEMVLGNVEDLDTADQVMALCILIIMTAAFGLVALYYAGRLFTNVHRDGTPFKDDNVKCLERLAVLLLVGTVALPAVGAAAVHFMGLQSDMMFQFNPIMLFMAVLFYFLSLIFKHGAALQKESDETL